MKWIFLFAIVSMLLFPMSSSFSQLDDAPPTLSVVLSEMSPYVYKDSDGFTVVIGEVKNNDNLSSVSDVQITVKFFDETGFQPIHIASGTTILDVIPPKGTSPYLIKSKSPDPQITSVDVRLESFSASATKSEGLEVESTSITNSGSLMISGILKNTGNAPVNDVTAYVAFYDAFTPPRLVGISTIPIGSLDVDEEIQFDFNEYVNPIAKEFYLFAESDMFNSNLVKKNIPEPDIISTQVMISDVYVADKTGRPISEIKKGSTVHIQAKSWFQTISEETTSSSYKFYAQVKQSGNIPYVEFLGTAEGSFVGTQREFPSVSWVPENPGVFFIETYVWNGNDVPIADPGPTILVIVK